MPLSVPAFVKNLPPFRTIAKAGIRFELTRRCRALLVDPEPQKVFLFRSSSRARSRRLLKAVIQETRRAASLRSLATQDIPRLGQPCRWCPMLLAMQEPHL